MTITPRLAIVLTLLFGSFAAAPARAWQGVESAIPAAMPSLIVGQEEAQVNFPDGIAFTLDAEAPGPVANVELMYREPGVETWSEELPTFTSGTTHLTVSDSLDLRSGELPPGLDVNYHWRVTTQDGDVLETPEQTVLWEDNRYLWTSLAGPHVTVYTYDASPEFQQAILDAAERTITRLSTKYDATPDQPIRIWTYARREDLYGALPPNSEPWIAGSAYPGLHLILAVLPPENLNEVKRVVPHEISHQVLGQATQNPFNSPPKWLDEGLAVYSQESGRESFYDHALELAATGQVPSLATFNGQFPYDHEGALAAYAFSLSAVNYILDTYGDEGMAHLIAAFPQGISFDDSIQQGLGVSFDELDQAWQADLIADAKRGMTASDELGGMTGTPVATP